MDRSLFPEQIFCRMCGTKMPTGTICIVCGWYDWSGISPHVQRLVERRRNLGASIPLAPPDKPPSWESPVEFPAVEGAITPLPLPPSAIEVAGPPLEVQRPATEEKMIEMTPAPSPQLVEVLPAEPPHDPPASVATVVAPPSSTASKPAAIAAPPKPPVPRPVPAKRGFGPRVIWKRFLPPVRLVWIFLGILVWTGGGFISRAVAIPLLLLPVLAAAADLGFQAVRFPRIRFPDAAIANGLFLTIILWPTSSSLALASVAVATVGIRHLVRVAGRPILNPAAAGVLIAATIFALPQPWHVGSTLEAAAIAAVLGLILWSKALHTWRIWAPYFAANVAMSVGIADYLGGIHAVPIVLQTTVLGASALFYGLFMVTEPRTAPSARKPMIMFGVIVGVAAAFLPTLFAEYTAVSALGVLCPYLALFAGNLFTLALPSARGVRHAAPRAAPVTGRALLGGVDAD